jgi:hypothetical protein
MMMNHQITVVLEHPRYCELSSVIMQREFEKYNDALVFYRGLCDLYTDGHYAVVYDTEEKFSIDKYNELLREMREIQTWGGVR